MLMGIPMQQTPLSKQKNRTPLCGHLSLLICGTSFFSCTNGICQEIFGWAWSNAQLAGGSQQLEEKNN
jgi:hypothetical protein